MIELFPPDPKAAAQVKRDIDAVVGQISAHELRLASSYARLGGLLREAKNKQYWVEWGYEKFTSFLEDVRTKIDRKRSQIYLILSVAEALLPYVSEETLENLGINKAGEIRRLVKEGRNPAALMIDVPLDSAFVPAPHLDQISPENVEHRTVVRLMDWAAKVTTAQLRAKINDILHMKEQSPGAWYEMPGFYATVEERKTLDAWWRIGRGLVEAKDETPEHQWKKEVIMLSAMEVIGTYSNGL